MAARDLIQPRGQNGLGLQPGSAPRQIDEDGLRDLLGKLRRADLAQRRGIDQAEVAPDDFCERILGVLPGIAREQFQVGVAHLWKHIGADLRNPPGNFTGPELAADIIRQSKNRRSDSCGDAGPRIFVRVISSN
jgi:hypothetical protein